jgi:hypothetical protein
MAVPVVVLAVVVMVVIGPVVVAVLVPVVVVVTVVVIATRAVRVVVVTPRAVFVVVMPVIVMVVVVRVVVLVAVVVMVVVAVSVVVVVRVRLAGLPPHRHRPDHDEGQHGDPADHHRQVELRRQDVLQHPGPVQLDRDEPEQPAHQDGQELLGEVVAERLAVVVMMRVRHETLR